MKNRLFALHEKLLSGLEINEEEINYLSCEVDENELAEFSRGKAREKYGNVIGYSPKVFLPVTQLCRNKCGYCTFVKDESDLASPFMDISQMIEVASMGAKLGCHEALFTLGEKPEFIYESAKKYLAEKGYASTVEYVVHAARRVYEETGLFPHINLGNMNRSEMMLVKASSASAGLMLESCSKRLMRQGGPHWKCPDKNPKKRLETIELAGELSVPFTTGLLVGIGETRVEIIESLLEIRKVNQKYGHIQEVIIQNFKSKLNTAMAAYPDLSLKDHLWVISLARFLLDSEISLQAPPNLRSESVIDIINAGINDFGGISPLTIDYVNPEASWPELDELRETCQLGGYALQKRLPLLPKFCKNAKDWVPEIYRNSINSLIDGGGYVKESVWIPGGDSNASLEALEPTGVAFNTISSFTGILNSIEAGKVPSIQRIADLFNARGSDALSLMKLADSQRKDQSGDDITFVKNCNINYTNICEFHCKFCAFAKSHGRNKLGDSPYLLRESEVINKAKLAWANGASEVCMQGGIHPSFDGNTYKKMISSIRSELPDIHIHAFSPLEISHGARTMGVTIRDYLCELKDLGLNSLPGTAAEILNDDIREIICPDKLSTSEWLDVMRNAHAVGLRSTATIMFGHVDGYEDWAKHLLHIRCLQEETGGFTEFVPLPFVPHESPLWKRGKSRMGPSLREAILMHSVARVVLCPLIKNIQTSWVKMGDSGAQIALSAGANDLGGTLMYESITRAAGGTNGQMKDIESFERIAKKLDRKLVIRNTNYSFLS